MTTPECGGPGAAGPEEIETMISALLQAVDSLESGRSRCGLRVACLFAEYLCWKEKRPVTVLFRTMERRIILDVLERVDGHQRRASRILGLKYTTLNCKIKRYGIRFTRRAYLEFVPGKPPDDPAGAFAAAEEPLPPSPGDAPETAAGEDAENRPEET